MSVVSEGRAKLGYGLGKDEGEAFWVLGMLETIKIGAADTDGGYGLVEVVARKGDGPPWHVHHEEDEWFYAIEGELTVYVADERVNLTPGSFAFGPMGVPHTFIAETEGAKVLVGFGPVQFEGFMREAGSLPPSGFCRRGPMDRGTWRSSCDRGETRVRHPRPPRPTRRALVSQPDQVRARSRDGRACTCQRSKRESGHDHTHRQWSLSRPGQCHAPRRRGQPVRGHRHDRPLPLRRLEHEAVLRRNARDAELRSRPASRGHSGTAGHRVLKKRADLRLRQSHQPAGHSGRHELRSAHVATCASCPSGRGLARRSVPDTGELPGSPQSARERRHDHKDQRPHQPPLRESVNSAIPRTSCTE